MPKISAVMALYNTPYNYLQATVESILSQNFTDFEFIVIDDASTIEYEDFFKTFKDERIKYFKLDKNSGPGAARNIGIRKAVGEYIAIVDSDDVYLPQRFSLQSQFFDNNSEVSLLSGGYRFSNKKKLSPVITGDREIKTYILFNSPFANPLIMFRRNVFVEKNLFYPENINFAEDYELWVDALFAGIKMENLEDFLMIYTRRKNQLSKTKADKQDFILKKLYEKIFMNFGLEVSQEEVNLHYNIYQGKYGCITSENEILNWFNKIIEKNAESNIFNESSLLKMKEDALCSYNCYKETFWHKLTCKNRVLKVEPLVVLESAKIASCDFGSPRVSAVMALYNTPYDLLKTTVESILSQTYADFELIVVDDASTKDYGDFFSKFKDNRIKYLKLDKNMGPGGARNAGIKEAVGEYVAIVDSDDIYMPNRFELQVDFLDKNPDISLLSGAFQFSNKKKISKAMTTDKKIKISMLFNSALTNAAVMFRREVFNKNNLFYPQHLNFGEDYALWIDAMFSKVKMANLPDILMIYVRRRNQLSKVRSKVQISTLKDLYAKAFSRMQLNFSQEEIDLHYNIEGQNFNLIKSSDAILNWFKKIIDKNKKLLIFSEEDLIAKRDEIVKKYLDSKNRLLKIKIGDYNILLRKPLRIGLEKRS